MDWRSAREEAGRVGVERCEERRMISSMRSAGRGGVSEFLFGLGGDRSSVLRASIRSCDFAARMRAALYAFKRSERNMCG